MKILHVTSTNIGGAGIAARRLNQALRAQGVDSEMFLAFGPDDLPHTTVLKGGAYWVARIRRSFIYRVMHLFGKTLCSIAVLPSGVRRKIIELKPDIVHLHWINGEMLRPKDLPKLGVPVVWTLHDMWPFCGAEHVTTEKRYVTGYQPSSSKATPSRGSSEFRVKSSEANAQGLKPKTSFDIDRWVFRRKQKAWKEWKPHIVTPSNWLANCARESVLFKNNSVERIPNCLDLNLFKPINQADMREKLGLPTDKKLILCGAASFDVAHKGMDLLAKSLLRISTDVSFEVVCVGGQLQSVDDIPVHPMGKISEQKTLVELYNAVDLFVLPSRIDNFPNMVAEAMSCGLPIVAFNICGLPDMVQHKNTGYLAKPFDCDDFADGIQWILQLDEKEYSELCASGRAKAEAEWAESVVASKYKAVYEKLMNRFVEQESLNH